MSTTPTPTPTPMAVPVPSTEMSGNQAVLEDLTPANAPKDCWIPPGDPPKRKFWWSRKFGSTTASESASPAIPDTNTGTCPVLPEPMPLTTSLPESQQPEDEQLISWTEVITSSPPEGNSSASAAAAPPKRKLKRGFFSKTWKKVKSRKPAADNDNCMFPTHTIDAEIAVATAPPEATTADVNDPMPLASITPIASTEVTTVTSELSPIVEKQEPEVAKAEPISERLDVAIAAPETSPEIHMDTNPQASSPAEGNSSPTAAAAPPKGKLKRGLFSKTWKKVKSRNAAADSDSCMFPTHVVDAETAVATAPPEATTADVNDPRPLASITPTASTEVTTVTSELGLIVEKQEPEVAKAEPISERLDVAIDAPETSSEIHMDPNPQTSSPAEGSSSASAADAPPKGKLKRGLFSMTWKKVKSRNQTSPNVS